MAGFVGLKEVKNFFHIQTDEIDSLLIYIIDLYSDKIVEKTGITETNLATKETTLYGIGCHLSKVAVEYVSSPIAYTVGDVRERLPSDHQRVDPTWCELYQESLDLIIAEEEQRRTFTAVARRRKGLSSQYDLY